MFSARARTRTHIGKHVYIGMHKCVQVCSQFVYVCAQHWGMQVSNCEKQTIMIENIETRVWYRQRSPLVPRPHVQRGWQRREAGWTVKSMQQVKTCHKTCCPNTSKHLSNLIHSFALCPHFVRTSSSLRPDFVKFAMSHSLYLLELC